MDAAKMTCHDVSEALNRRALGEAEADDAARAEAHLARCAACRAEAETLRAVIASLREAPAPPAGYGEALARQLQGRLPRLRRRGRAAWGVWPMAAAASLLAALMLALLSPAPAPSSESILAAKVRALPAAERAFLFADYLDAEGWRADDGLLALLREEAASSAGEKPLPPNGFFFHLSDDELRLLHEAVASEPKST